MIFLFDVPRMGGSQIVLAHVCSPENEARDCVLRKNPVSHLMSRELLIPSCG